MGVRTVLFVNKPPLPWEQGGEHNRKRKKEGRYRQEKGKIEVRCKINASGAKRGREE